MGSALLAALPALLDLGKLIAQDLNGQKVDPALITAAEEKAAADMVAAIDAMQAAHAAARAKAESSLDL